MADIDMRWWLYALTHKMETKEVEQLPASHRASVAVVFRVRDSAMGSKAAGDGHASEEPLNAVRRMLVSSSPQCEVEMLFIKRAVQERDRWSGQVAFPGGKMAKDVVETDFDTAVREAKEEVGLDLRKERDFVCIGRVDDEVALKGNILTPEVTLAVGCFLFVQLCPVTPQIAIEFSEVADVRWVPVRFFLGPPEDRVKEVAYRMDGNEAGAFSVLTWLGIDAVYFPGLILPGEDQSHCNDPATGKPYVYHLWGLTYRITRRIMLHAKKQIIRDHRLRRRAARFTRKSPAEREVEEVEDASTLKDDRTISARKRLEQTHFDAEDAVVPFRTTSSVGDAAVRLVMGPFGLESIFSTLFSGVGALLAAVVAIFGTLLLVVFLRSFGGSGGSGNPPARVPLGSRL